MKLLITSALFLFNPLFVQAAPSCSEYFHYKFMKKDWPYNLPMGDFEKYFSQDCGPKLPPLEHGCEPAVICGKVDTVARNGMSARGFVCTSGEKKFDCSLLVEEWGLNLLSQNVGIKFPTTDTCHLPGACGPSACVALTYQMGEGVVGAACLE